MHGPSRDAGPSRFYSAALTAQARACARLSCCSTRYHCTRSDIATWRARVRTKASAGVCRPRGQPGPLAAPCTTGILKPAELPSRLRAQCNVTTIHNDGRLIPTSSLVRSELLKARLEFAVYIPPCDVAYCNRLPPATTVVLAPGTPKLPHLMLALLAVAAAFSPPPVFTDPLAASLPAAPAGTVRSFPDASMTMEQVQSWLWGSLEAEEDQEGEPEEIERSSRRALLALKAYKAMYG